jgi:hypothetical protein
MELENFVRVYNNAVPEDVCKHIIDLFEDCGDHHTMSEIGQGEMDSGYRSALELNCSKQEKFRDILDSMNLLAVNMRSQYFTDIKESGVPALAFPADEPLRLEEWRMHRYDDNSSFYKPHVDCHDEKSSKRYLALLFYMNDVQEGGETRFTDHLEPLQCHPKEGRLLIFPAWWGFPHEALPPKSNPKYLLKTYFHYV